MRITIDLDKRRPNGKPTIHVSPREISIYKNGKLTLKTIQLEMIEHGATVPLGKMDLYGIRNEKPMPQVRW